MFEDLRTKLSEAGPPYVFFAAGVEDRFLKRIVMAAAGSQKLGILDGNRMRSWDEFFSEFSREFDFPDYFGWNMNAFADVMRDLGWIDAVGYIVLVLNSERVLSEEPDGADVLSEYGDFIGSYWATPIKRGEWFDRDARPFHTILHRELPVGSVTRATPLNLSLR